MPVPEPKVCASCGRTITWRKKWAKNWDDVRYCSAACRRAKVSPTDQRLEQAILDLLDRQPRNGTVDPSDAARAVGGPQWQALTEPARAAARRLAATNTVVIMQSGREVDPSTARGPLQVRRRRTS